MTAVDGTAVAEIADLTRAAEAPEELEPGKIYAFRFGDRVEKVDLTGDEYRDAPRHKTGLVRVRNVGSFATYWAKHATDGVSEVYADRDHHLVAGILDAHGPNVAGWAAHKIVLHLKFSEAFKAWTGNDGRFMDQETFAEFLDDNAPDIRDPDAATMLEIAQTIQGTSKVEWQAGHRLSDGQRRIGFLETNTATAGTRGELAIPTAITVGVQIYDGAEVAHALIAKFRHRIEGGKLRLQYKLHRPNDVVTAAFNAAVNELSAACAVTVLRGTPSGTPA